MSIKTERITILTTPNFKGFLHAEAEKEGISVSELIRERCMSKPLDNDDELLLRELVDQVNESTQKAKKSLSKGLRDAKKILDELKAGR